ncbi:MAG TPA: hypothetical protein VEX63_06680 [Flavisolibacter sp.]|nr:hypothetical protein [Flavisolibacter sp.]
MKKSFLLALLFICVQLMMGNIGFCQDLAAQFPDSETETVTDAAHFTDTWPDEQLTGSAMEPGQATTSGQFKKQMSQFETEIGDNQVLSYQLNTATFQKIANCRTSYLMLIFPFHNFW